MGSRLRRALIVRKGIFDMLTVEVIFYDRNYVTFPSKDFGSILVDMKRISGRGMDDVREMIIRS